ncbi:MAG: S8 family peptidase [Bacillota bacterium]
MKLTRVCLALIILGLIVFAVPLMASGKAKGPDFAADQILVKFKAGTSVTTKQKVHARHGGQAIDEIAALGVQVVKVPAGKALEKVKAYKDEAAVEYAEPDYVAEAVGVPNDPYFDSQWGMTKIQTPGAWDMTTGSTNVKIAILDTGVDQDHPDLADKITANKNFTRSKTVDDKYGHGTHVAGIAAAFTNNGIGVAGTGYNCMIMNGKVLGDNGSGYNSWIAGGITWAADNGAKVINMSLGSTAPSTTLEDAVKYAWGKGVVICAAAGNSGTSDPLYPARYDVCIAVAATDQNDVKASFSSYGDWVDVAAPGVSIFSTLPNHKSTIRVLDYGSLSGTSMATPHVSGLAALLWATGYGADNNLVRWRIESTCDPVSGTGEYWTNGRINAYQAVSP